MLLGATATQARGYIIETAPPTVTPEFDDSLLLGVNTQIHYGDLTGPQQISVMDGLQSAGAQWVRIDVGWSAVAQSGPGALDQWYLDIIDDAIDLAAARGMKVLACYTTTPAWARSGGTTSTPPTNLTTYSDSCAQVAAYFAGRVHAWQLWNEPNHTGFWTGTATQYATMMKPCYSKIKANDPNALVICGPSSYVDTTWYDALFQQGIVGHYDRLAAHPYMSAADLDPDLADDGTFYRFKHLDALRALQLSYNDDSKIWLTEFGWSSHSNGGTEQPWEMGVSQANQAQYFTDAVAIAQARPWVGAMFWYVDRDRTDRSVHENNFGLLTTAFAPKPVHGAFRTAQGLPPL